MPFAVGQSWNTHGTHTDVGFAWGGTKNALDFAGGDGHVLAAGDGTVRIVTCRKGPHAQGGSFVVIDHGNDWHTGYYHVVNIRVVDGQHVNAGTWIADTGTAWPCGGGADGAHVHFTLWRYPGTRSTYPGGPIPWDGITIGGWVFHDDPSRWDCDRNGRPCGSATRLADGRTVTLPASITSYGDSLPPTPTLVSVTAVTTSSATLSWASVSGADGYVVSLNGSRVASIGATTFTFSGLSCAKGYTLGVQASRAGRLSQPATKLAATGNCATPTPQPPARTTVSAVAATSATLSWDAVSGVDGYVLWLNGSSVASAGATQTSYTFTGLSCATRYVLGVQSRKSGQVSAVVTQPATTSGCQVARFPLTVSTAGPGTVTSNAGGINCGAACTVMLDSNATVTLSVTPARNAVFGGWSGSCSGTGPCTLKMDAAKSVTAAFFVRGTADVPAGQTLNVRSGPATTYPLVGSFGNGAPVLIVCQIQGQVVNGMWGPTAWWDRLSTGGFASDGFVYTGSNGRVAPNC